MNVFFGGDFVPHDRFARASPDVRRYIDSRAFVEADLRIVNLEAPIVAPDEGERHPWGGLFVTEPSCAALRLLRVDAVSLANNHIFDCGADGVAATIRHVRTAGIASFGAGPSESEAHRPFRFADNYGVWGYAHVDGRYLVDLPVADGDRPGVAELTTRKVWRDLDAATDVEHAVLSVHWGREHTVLPPAAVIRCALEIAQHPKVRLIVGAHPHRLQGIRRVRAGTIAFSLGHLHVPGFVIAPPLTMAGFEGGQLPITRGYHRVARPTLKLWPALSRLSAGIVIDTDTHAAAVVPLHQAGTGIRVRELHAPFRQCILLGCRLAGFLTHLPAPLIDAYHAFGSLVDPVRRVYWMARSNGVAFAWTALRRWVSEDVARRAGQKDT